MSKYDPLANALRLSVGRVEYSFSDIEEILGEALPSSARRHAAWWSNSGGTHVQSHAWLSAGYRTAQVDIEQERLIFEPERDQRGFSEVAQSPFKLHDATKQEKPADAKQKDHPLFGIWKGKVTLIPDYDYTQPADPDWGKVYED